MATTVDFIKFVCEKIDNFDNIRYRKMFGEYMVYINDKPILLVCDNIVYVKKLDCINELMQNSETGTPYPGAKQHYVLDIENYELLLKLIPILENVTPLPKKKKR